MQGLAASLGWERSRELLEAILGTLTQLLRSDIDLDDKERPENRRSWRATISEIDRFSCATEDEIEESPLSEQSERSLWHDLKRGMDEDALGKLQALGLDDEGRHYTALWGIDPEAAKAFARKQEQKVSRARSSRVQAMRCGSLREASASGPPISTLEFF